MIRALAAAATGITNRLVMQRIHHLSFALRFSRLLAAFSESVRRTAARINTIHVACLTREGTLFHHCHTATWDNKARVSRIFPASRISTFGPAFSRRPQYHFSRIQHQYPKLTLAGLMRSLDVWESIASASRIAESTPWNTTIDAIEPEYVVWVLQHTRTWSLLLQRAELIQRAVERMFPSKRVLCCDIGWRGTMQDNLQTICNDVDWHGVYLGLDDPLFPSDDRSTKYSAGIGIQPLALIDRLVLKLSPGLEMLCNCAGGSSLRWIMDAGGNPVCLKKVHRLEDVIWHVFTSKIQRDVLSRIGTEYCSIRSLSDDKIGTMIAALHRSLLLFPSLAASRAFGALHHDESFGSDRILNPGQASLFGSPRSVWRSLYAHVWPQSWLKTCGLGILLPVYNHLRRNKP